MVNMKTAHLEENHPLGELILRNYAMFLDGCSLTKLTAVADRINHESMAANI